MPTAANTVLALVLPAARRSALRVREGKVREAQARGVKGKGNSQSYLF